MIFSAILSYILYMISCSDCVRYSQVFLQECWDMSLSSGDHLLSRQGTAGSYYGEGTLPNYKYLPLHGFSSYLPIMSFTYCALLVVTIFMWFICNIFYIILNAYWSSLDTTTSKRYHRGPVR